ncbi:YfhO family protein [Gimesia aquarii]|uniref:Bacterial membrane protein YfhO n=1 Tax=Gimesia aquarii TaxID=2527964 RepID=A0A517WV79_9PLAN|nr:YfhO family protein [Gimesia aquarii]QDU09167.1 Bacterial membrane protein YfhO [Gimesia aquarii]
MTSKLFQNAIAALVLALISGLCFQVLLINPSDVLVGSQDNGHNDTTNTFIALKNYQKDSIERQQHIPYWNPYSLLGVPVLGNPQTSLFYPGNWIFFFTNALSTMSWVLIFHHWWAGWGTYLLARKYQLNFFSSILSGIIFLAAPYFVAKTGEGHFTSITQIAWFPWIFYGYELLIEGRKKAPAVMAIFIALAFFCGHVQEVYYLLLFLTASIVIESVIAFFQKNRKVDSDQLVHDQIKPEKSSISYSAGSLLKSWLITGILTVGLVAIDLVPVYIYTQQAVRASGIDAIALKSGSLSLPSLLQLLDPFVWGGPDHYRGSGGYYWEAVCYFGCLPLLLACVGILTSIRNRTVLRLFLIGLTSFLLAFGPHLQFYTLLYDIVPGFSMFRMPARLLWICSLIIALLAGFGCESIMSLCLNTVKKRYRILSLIGLVTTSLLLFYLIYSSQGVISFEVAPQQVFKIQLISFFVAVLTLSIAVFSASFSHKSAICGSLLLCVVATGELTLHSNHILRSIPQSSFRAETKITKFLKANLGQHRVLVGQKLMSDREAWDNQILKVQGYEPVPLVRLGLLAAAAFPQPDAALMMAGYSKPQLSTARKPILDLMSVKYAVLETEKPIEIDGWKIVDQGSIPEEFALRDSEPATLPYLILENVNPLPRAYLIGNTKTLNPNEPSKQIVETIAKLQPKNEVFLQADILPQGKRQSYKAATIKSAGPDHLEIQAELDTPGYLILSDIYYPGWSAHVKDKSIPILPANFSLRAIPLPAGKHVVQLSFTPPGFKIGRIISLTTLAVILILLLMSSRSSKEVKPN